MKSPRRIFEAVERQQRGEDVPAVSVVPARRQAHRRVAAQALEVAGHQRAAPGVEALQLLQLGQADAGGHIAQVVLAAGEQHVGAAVGVALQAVEALQLDRGQLAARRAG